MRRNVIAFVLYGTLITILLSIGISSFSNSALTSPDIAYAGIPKPPQPKIVPCKTNAACAPYEGEVCTYNDTCGVPAGNGDLCMGNGQGDCQKNSQCLAVANPVLCTAKEHVAACNEYRCQADPTLGKACYGTGRGNCADDHLKCVNDVCQSTVTTCGGLVNGICANGGQCENMASMNSAACARIGGSECENYQCVGGTQAQAPTPSVTLVPPISPPCAQFKGGQCVMFATAIGKIATNFPAFVSAVFGIMIAISGGLALLIIIYAGYRFMVSQGKPEALQAAREQLIAAIVGLLFIIFSMVILQAIGVDILNIPGLMG